MWHIFKLVSDLFLLVFIYIVVQKDFSPEKHSHPMTPCGHKPDSFCSSDWLEPVIKTEGLN